MNIPERYYISASSGSFSSYWKPTSFNLLPHYLPKETNVNDSTSWIKYYFMADDVGDQVAKEYLLTNGYTKGMQKLLDDLHHYPENIKSLSEATISLFHTFTNIPEWVNFNLIQAGTNYSNRCSTSSLSVLRNYCLMGGYESSAINKPLIFTGSLKKGAVKRLSDTVDFWMKVNAKDGLKPKQDGILSVFTTRMIHSFSRIMIEKQPEWKTQLWGRPINTWDMVATNLGFSIAFADGLAKLQLPPTDEELNGTLHLWKYVGYLLGIPTELLPNTPAEASQSLYLWSKTQKGIDADSKALVYALYEEPLKVAFTKNRFMKWFVQKTNLGFNEVLLGNKSREALGLPYSNAKYWILFLNRINRFIDRKAKRNNAFYDKMAAKGRKDQVQVWKLYQKA